MRSPSLGSLRWCQGHVAVRLNQEFIRIKAPGRAGEADRAATLCALVTRTFTDRTIVFFDTKAGARTLTLTLMFHVFRLL